MTIEICGSCQTQINNKKCSCGIWLQLNDPDVKQFLIFKNCLISYANFVEKNILPPVFSADIPIDNIQGLFFKGTLEETEMLKSVLETTRKLKSELMETNE